jgi:hypothetical protein
MKKANADKNVARRSSTSNDFIGDVDERKREAEEPLERYIASLSNDREHQGTQSSLFNLLSANTPLNRNQIPQIPSALSFGTQIANQPLFTLSGTHTNPQLMDVLLGRGRGHGTHPGNRLYRRLIAENADSYNDTNSRRMKTYIVEDIVRKIQDVGVFRKFNGAAGNWEQVDENQAKVKTAHALRYLHRRDSGEGSIHSSEQASAQTNDRLPTQAGERVSAQASASHPTSQHASIPAALSHVHQSQPIREELLSDQQILRGIGIDFDGQRMRRIPPEPIHPIIQFPTGAFGTNAASPATSSLKQEPTQAGLKTAPKPAEEDTSNDEGDALVDFADEEMDEEDFDAIFSDSSDNLN